MVDRISLLLNKLGFWHLPAVYASLLLPPPKDLADHLLNSASILTLIVLRSTTPVIPLQGCSGSRHGKQGFLVLGSTSYFWIYVQGAGPITCKILDTKAQCLSGKRLYIVKGT